MQINLETLRVDGAKPVTRTTPPTLPFFSDQEIPSPELAHPKEALARLPLFVRRAYVDFHDSLGRVCLTHAISRMLVQNKVSS